MALKWYMGDFMTGQIDKTLELPVIDGSTSIDHDVNGEDSADIKINRSLLPSSLSNNWKIAFESYDKMIVCIDEKNGTEDIIFGGFIYKNQIDIDSGDVLSIQARGILDYLRNRLMISTFDNETDASKSVTLKAPSWRSLIIKLVQHAFSSTGIPSGAPRPPQVIENIESDDGDGVTFKTLYVDAYTYGDRLEDIRDNLSSKGQEFKFIPVWDGTSRTKIKFRLIVGSASNPHIGFNSDINIRLEENGNAKITKFSSTSSGENKRNRFFIQSSNDEKKTDLTTKYTGGSSSVLIDDFFNSPVELTSSELAEQLNARSDDMNSEMIEISLTVVGESKKDWYNNLGKKMTITGFSNTTSAGHSTVVRIVEIGFDDTDVITIGVQTPAQRYPRLPKQRTAEAQRKNKKSSKLKNQKYYKGGTGSSKWKETSLGNSGFDGGGGDGGGGGGDGGTDPVDPGPLDPGESADWGTGGGNNGEDTPVEGSADFEYVYINSFESPYFAMGNTVAASNNTIWSCPTFMTFSNSFNPTDESQFLTLNTYSSTIYSGILHAGGISEARVAKEFDITPENINSIFEKAQGHVVPKKPVSFTDSGTIYDYEMKKSYGYSSNPVVLDDGNLYLPLHFGVSWGMRRWRGSNVYWNTRVVADRPYEVKFGFVCFMKLKINDMTDLSDPILSDKDFRGDLPYIDEMNPYRFVRYGSWIIMHSDDYDVSVTTSAANYNPSTGSIPTWWTWGVVTQGLAIGYTKNKTSMAVYRKGSTQDSAGFFGLPLQLYPVPQNNSVPIRWETPEEEEGHGLNGIDMYSNFTCLGRLFRTFKKDTDSQYSREIVVQSLDTDLPSSQPLQKVDIGSAGTWASNYKMSDVITTGRHVYIPIVFNTGYSPTMLYGQIVEKDEGGAP